MTPSDYLDIHTHNLDAGPSAIINVPFGAEIPAEGSFSVGIHPWDTEAEPDYGELARLAALPQVAAIGETGLDALRGAPIPRQKEIFLEHVRLSELLGKPLIIHAVRTAGILLELRRELKPAQQWIVHGFRGKPELARQLLRAGFDISLGEKFNPGVPQVVPPGRLYAETDTSSLPIADIRAAIARAAKI